MNLVIEAVQAMALVGLPIMMFTLVIVWWGMRAGHFLAIDDHKALRLELKAMSKGKTKPENDQRGLVQKKWARFGGGFYGIVAFFTYTVIEVTEIATMIIDIGGLWDFISHLGIDVIISIFVDALTNFIAAMIWPVYWLDRIETDYTWIWFVAAYAGYWLGLKLAQQLNHLQSEELNAGRKIFTLEYIRHMVARYLPAKKAESGRNESDLNGREK